jgi:peptidoglycan/xylan/chitin deacetylase (PgdA/CDA1 family)
MNWLKEHYPVLSLDEVPGLLEQDMKKDIFVITFDDGYRDNFTQAFPILDKLGLTAAVYLTTDYIGRDKEFPWLAKLGPPAYLVLDWEQVRQMKEAGWVFGTHTGSHVSLGAMNRDRQREEIERCTGVFSRQLGQPPRHFCYPFGTFADFNEDTLELLKEKNYHTATTAVAGANHRREDPLQLRRTAIDPSDSFFLYKCHLKGYLDVLAWKDGPTAGRVKRFLRRAIGL